MQDEYQVPMFYSLLTIPEGHLCLMGVETLDDPSYYSLLGIGFSFEPLYCVTAATHSASKFTGIPEEIIVPCPVPEGITWIPCEEDFADCEKSLFIL